MDVHAPHQPVHTWRDFAIHLTIVTIGLFIALSLEAFVEYVHHRHLVAEARENIRMELQNNHNAAQHDLILLQQGIDQQKANIIAIHGLMTTHNFHGEVKNTMDIDSLSDSAWHTARDTGALGFMPYDEVQRYSDLYMLGDLVNTTTIDTAKQDFLAGAAFDMGYDPDKLPPQEFSRLLHDNAAIQIQFFTLKQIVSQYDDAILAELKGH
jgi:hypothetical protein